MKDILIIGGGIAGISIAARLSHDADVAVLEAENALGHHASGRSAALFEASYGLPPTIALNRASADYHHTKNGGYLSPRGLMFVGRSHEKELFDRETAEMGLHVISIEEARRKVPILNPDACAFAAFHEEAWDLDTDRMIQDFAKEVRGNGGTIHLNAKVSAVVWTGAHWQVEAGDQQFQAKLLVNAAGAWVDQIAEMAGISPLGFVPCRRSMARIPAPGGHDVSSWPMFFGTGERWYAKPDAGQLIVSPAEEDPVEPHDAWADDMVLAEGLARYEEMVTEPVTRITANWAGLRTFSPDKSLVLGQSSGHAAFFWCAGQGGYGFQTAPAASRLTADLILGRAPELAPEWVAALSPARFE